MNDFRPAGGGGSGGAPSGAAGGSLTGTYPNPTIATIPSGATATTQSAADASTKVSTTAYVDTGLALKANLAGPTFTGSPVLPTGTTGTTQSAADGSTKLATTAYVDTADALKANLAGPTFTGSPVLPTGTTGVTQTALDSSTKLATTAYADRVTTGSYRLGLNTYANFNPAMSVAQASQQNANDARYVTIVIDQTGNLRDINFYIVTANAGNSKIFVLDTGQANATHTTRTCTAISGSLSGASTGWMAYDPNLAVTKGDTLHLCITCPDTTIKVACGPGTIVAAGLTVLPASFLPSSGAGTSTQKISGNILAANVPALSGTVTDANMANSPASCPLVCWRIS